MRVINDHADKTGKKVMYAANLTGEIDEMLARHDLVLAEGGTCVMASMNSIGLPAMKMLRAHSQLPIHGHRNGWGLLGRSPAIGMSYIAFQKLWRLAGIDHTHVNGIDNKFCESNESVIASARELSSSAPMWSPELNLSRKIGSTGCALHSRSVLTRAPRQPTIGVSKATARKCSAGRHSSRVVPSGSWIGTTCPPKPIS